MANAAVFPVPVCAQPNMSFPVKAAGIAKDLFGSQEHYVLPVQSLKDPQDLVCEFQWLMEQENLIREHLQKTAEIIWI